MVPGFRKKVAIPLSKKLEIVKFAYPEGRTKQIKPTAREFGVAPSQIRKWKANFDAINNVVQTSSDKVGKKIIARNHSSKMKRLSGAGAPSLFNKNTVDKMRELYDFRRQKTWSVSTYLLMIEAMKVAPECCSYLTDHAIRCRVHRLLNKWDITWRRGTHKAQNNRFDAQVVADFRQYVGEKIKMLDIKEENIWNCDQTNVDFDQAARYTLAERGSKTVTIKGADSSNRATAMLCCSKTEKALPFVVFKGVYTKHGLVKKELLARVGFPDNCHFTCQAKAWFDERVMLQWIEDCWKPIADKCPPDELMYLLLDECRVHLTQNIRKAFDNLHTEIDFIPGGYTCKLQVLDVGINKPFKVHIYKNFDNWMIQQDQQQACRPLRQDVTHWITRSWNAIPVSILINSWRKAFEDEVPLAELARNPRTESTIRLPKKKSKRKKKGEEDDDPIEYI